MRAAREARAVVEAPVAAFVMAGRRCPERGNAAATAASAVARRSRRLPPGEWRASFVSRRIELNVPICEGVTADRLEPSGRGESARDAGRRTTALRRPRRVAPGRPAPAAGHPLPDDPTGVGVHSRCGDHAGEGRCAAVPRHPAQGGQARSRNSSPISPRRAAGRTAERREPSRSPPPRVPLTPFGQERRGA